MPRRARSTTVHTAALREVRVLRIEDVTPGLRRVTLTGDQLGAFSPGEGEVIPEFASTGFDDDIRMIFAHPGQREPVLPYFQGGTWHAPKDPRPLGRYYTVRRWDPVTRELDVDFVKHGVGVAATWAYRAQPGDRVHFGGPSASQGLPEGFDWLLVAGDDTAAPAIARLLEELPDDARGQVFIEVADLAHRQPLRELPGVEVTWLSRAGAAAGGTLLLDAVQGASWWDGSVFAWVAGEQSAVRDIRRHLVQDRAVPKGDIDFVGYWKRTAAPALAEDPSLPDPEQEDDSFERFHHKSEILPPLAIRVAIELGLGELILAGVRTPAALAQRTGTVEWALRKFLRYLETIELVSSRDDEYTLTASGEELAEAWMIRVLHPGGVTARLEQGLFGLAESLRSGEASYASVTGRDIASLRSDAAFERELLDERSEGAEYLAGPLVAAAPLDGAAHVLIDSDIAGAVASLVAQAHPDTEVTILASAAHAAWLRDDLPATISDPTQAARVRVVEEDADTSAAADVVLVVDRLADHPDAEAAALLRRHADRLAPGGRLLVSEDTLDLADVDDHDAEEDLLRLTVNGSGYRTDLEIDALIGRAGLKAIATERFGWRGLLRTLVLD